MVAFGIGDELRTACSVYAGHAGQRARCSGDTSNAIVMCRFLGAGPVCQEPRCLALEHAWAEWLVPHPALQHQIEPVPELGRSGRASTLR